MKPKRRVNGGTVPFKQFLKEFKSLIIWGASGSAIAPLLVGLSSIVPPWPARTVTVSITSVVNLSTLIVLYHFMQHISMRARRATSIISSFLLVIMIIAYLAATSILVFEAGPKRERMVKGFVCTQVAATVFPTQCPLLDHIALSKGEYEPDELWAAWSITIDRVLLCILWTIFFVTLSVLVGSFILGRAEIAETLPIGTASAVAPSDGGRRGDTPKRAAGGPVD